MDPAAAPAYEDFEPPHNVVQEPDADAVVVDLSGTGFKKEHIKVRIIGNYRRLVVTGERPIAGDRWSRFRTEFPVPNRCNIRGITAQFENGAVRVTMPRPAASEAPPEHPPEQTGTATGQEHGDGSAHKTGDHSEPPLEQTNAAAGQDHRDESAHKASDAREESGKKDYSVQKQQQPPPLEEEDDDDVDAAGESTGQEQRHAATGDDDVDGVGDDGGGIAGKEAVGSRYERGRGQGYPRKVVCAVVALVVLVLVGIAMYGNYTQMMPSDEPAYDTNFWNY